MFMELVENVERTKAILGAYIFKNLSLLMKKNMKNAHTKAEVPFIMIINCSCE